MPKHGDKISGRFCESIDPHKPFVWDDPKYFNVPIVTSAPVIPPEDEATRISRRLAAAVHQSKHSVTPWPRGYVAAQIKRINAESETR